MTKLTWYTKPTVAYKRGMDKITHNIIRTLDKKTQKYATKMVGWMVSNRPWQDITGMARDSLYAESTHDTASKEITLAWSHGFLGMERSWKGQTWSYGFFLEYRINPLKARRPIIIPAYQEFIPDLWKEIQDLMS